MPIYGELHRFIPVLAHYRGFRVAELPVNHRPREHGRSRYGMERYVRGFLDLLTVTFMGRYRHRPLHLFGGLGLLLGALGTILLVYLTVLKLTGEAIGHRPLLTLGVLLVVVGVQLLSLGLVSELIASHHEERTGGGRTTELHVDEILADDAVLYFGTYERAYPRNAQVISRLRGAGVEVVERHVGVWEGRGTSGRSGSGPPPGPPSPRRGSCSAAGRALRRCDRRLSRPPRPARRKAGRAGRPVVFNPLVSLHETLVEDRGRFARVGSRPAPRRVDRHALRRADLVVADTERTRAPRRPRGSPDERLSVCFVGAEERLFRPGWKPPALPRAFRREADPAPRPRDDPRGGAAPPEIPFRVVGSGQLDALLRDRPANVEWVEWVDYERLPAEIQRAGCALGVFGTSAKAGRVIPNKAFQALACGTPLVTADTPAARELLATARARCSSRPATPRRSPPPCAGSPASRCSRGGSGGRPSGLPGACERARARRALARPRRAARRPVTPVASSGSRPPPWRASSARPPCCATAHSAAAASTSAT